MKNDLFYIQAKETELNKRLVAKFEKFARNHPDTQIFLLNQ